jgi:hypothetical protein
MQIHSVGIDLGKMTFHLVALGAAGKVLKALPRSLHRTARTKEQSQRRVPNLLTEWPPAAVALKDRHARISSWPGELISTQRPNTFAQTCLSPKLALAISRRTIHPRHLDDKSSNRTTR